MASPAKTALVLVDPYNDFLHPTGMLTPRLRESLEANNTIEHLIKAVTAARKLKIPIYYALHQQWKPGFAEGWNHLTDGNSRQRHTHFLAENTFGTQIYAGLEPDLSNDDVLVSRHWNSKYVDEFHAFANTDQETDSVASL